MITENNIPEDLENSPNSFHFVTDILIEKNCQV
jgi:hypothetical protein